MSNQAPADPVAIKVLVIDDSNTIRRSAEIFLARTAFGTGPVHRDRLPGSAWRNAMLCVAQGLVVNPSADETHPGSGFAHVRSLPSLQWSQIVATANDKK